MFLVEDRNGDLPLPRRGHLRAYLAARQDAAARYDLIRNWRSEPALLTAVNAVFEGVRQPFVLDAIPFVPVEAARPSRPLVVAGDTPEPFRLWFLERDNENKLYPKARAARRAAEATAVEIARLLRLADEGKTRLPAADGGGDALEGGDIAVWCAAIARVPRGRGAGAPQRPSCSRPRTACSPAVRRTSCVAS